MLNISGNNIELTRGDTAYIDFVPVNADGSEYVIASGDHAYFRLQGDSVITIPCIAEVGSAFVTLALQQSNTVGLDYKAYPYEVEIVTASNEHFTFITGGFFTVTLEIEEHN